MKIVRCLLATGIGAGLVGCASTEWRYEQPDLSSSQILSEQMIANCHLTPDEYLMIDLVSEGFVEAVWGKTCSQIHSYLARYHQGTEKDWRSLFSNPAVDSGLPGVTGLRYAVFTVGQVGVRGSWDVLVDLSEDQVMYGNDVIGNLMLGRAVPLTSRAKAAWLEGLAPVTGWDGAQLWPDEVPDDPTISWGVVVVAADGQAYRWQGERVVPAGFQQVYAAFQALTQG